MALAQETIRSWIDGNKRLYMALFVYLNIAISKLPCWSRFWEELEPRLPIKFTSHEFRDRLSDFESFKSKQEVEVREIVEPLNRLGLRSKILKEFDPKFEQDDDQWELSEDFLEFPKDLPHMDGLLSATMPGNFDEVRVSRFFSLATIDWKLAIKRLSLGQFDIDDFNDMSLFHLVYAILKFRFDQTRHRFVFKKEHAKDCFTPEQFVQVIESVAKNPVVFFSASYRKLCNRILVSSGEVSRWVQTSRWLELYRLIGEEIYLFLKPEENEKLPLFDIPWALKNGDDEDFDRRKNLLLSSQRWLREPCVQLRGMVGWIEDAIIASKSDKDTATNSSRLTQQKIKGMFGDDVLDN